MKKNPNLKKNEIKTPESKQADKDKKQFFIETIAKYCDKCGSPYTTSDIQIIQESRFSTIIHFSCQNCKSTHIASFIRPVGVSSRMPINSDLIVEEISTFADKNPIQADDVLDVYTELEKSEGRIEF